MINLREYLRKIGTLNVKEYNLTTFMEKIQQFPGFSENYCRTTAYRQNMRTHKFMYLERNYNRLQQ